MLYGPVMANTATELHHIIKVAECPQRRMDKTNWLSVCKQCHKDIEGDVVGGFYVRMWSDANYDKNLRNACQEESQHLKKLS